MWIFCFLGQNLQIGSSKEEIQPRKNSPFPYVPFPKCYDCTNWGKSIFSRANFKNGTNNGGDVERGCFQYSVNWGRMMMIIQIWREETFHTFYFEKSEVGVSVISRLHDLGEIWFKDPLLPNTSSWIISWCLITPFSPILWFDRPRIRFFG